MTDRTVTEPRGRNQGKRRKCRIRAKSFSRTPLAITCTFTQARTTVLNLPTPDYAICCELEQNIIKNKKPQSTCAGLRGFGSNKFEKLFAGAGALDGCVVVGADRDCRAYNCAHDNDAADNHRSRGTVVTFACGFATVSFAAAGTATAAACR